MSDHKIPNPHDRDAADRAAKPGPDPKAVAPEVPATVLSDEELSAVSGGLNPQPLPPRFRN